MISKENLIKLHSKSKEKVPERVGGFFDPLTIAALKIFFQLNSRDSYADLSFGW